MIPEWRQLARTFECTRSFCSSPGTPSTFVWMTPPYMQLSLGPLLKQRCGGRAQTDVRQLQEPRVTTARKLTLVCVAPTDFCFPPCLPAWDVQTSRLTVSLPEEKQGQGRAMTQRQLEWMVTRRSQAEWMRSQGQSHRQQINRQEAAARAQLGKVWSTSPQRGWFIPAHCLETLHPFTWRLFHP